MQKLAAIVLAAGKGTRMKSDRPKVLHAIAGRPLIEFPTALASELGCDPIVCVLGHGAAQVQAHLERLPCAGKLRFALQVEQRGTAHAVRCAADALRGFEGSVLVLSGDVPLLTPETIGRLLAAPAAPVAFLSARPASARGYGRVARDAEGRVARIIEEKDCAAGELAISEVNAGIYRIEADFLWSALGRVGSQNAQGEFYLTDLIALAARSGGAHAILADALEVAGINDRAELGEAAAQLRRRIHRRHQLAGVTIVAPENTFIDLSVQLGRDVTVEPGCILTGSTEVAEGAQLRAYSVLEDAKVGPRCLIGPFARLRPGTVLAADVHLGNFVETKNATLGERTKANHLSYLGDAEIGAGVNVGAGTITCNYDGVHKHLTRLGDGVFVGSDTQFVAPVSVGAGAYVGAGSTITEDVPADSLALSRTTQKVVEGWAARRRLAAGPKKA